MRKSQAVLIILCLIASMFAGSPALAAPSDYLGQWVCVAIDNGDGVKQTEYEGSAVADMLKITFREDGTMTVDLPDGPIEGSWKETEDGLTAEVNGEEEAFELKDGQLVNESDGTLVYLEKAAQKKKGGLLGALKAAKYAGQWVATGIDQGDGKIITQMDGMDIADLMTISIKRDGTLVLSSLGVDTEGTWAETADGIAITIDGETTGAVYQDGKLSAVEDGQTVYFERTSEVPRRRTHRNRLRRFRASRAFGPPCAMKPAGTATIRS